MKIAAFAGCGLKLVAVLLPLAMTARAADASDTRLALYSSLAREIRCPASRNMSIADSTQPVAADRRRELQDLVAAGMNEAEIRRFIKARYGDAALYSPPLARGTLALWVIPVLLPLAAALAWLRTTAPTAIHRARRQRR